MSDWMYLNRASTQSLIIRRGFLACLFFSFCFGHADAQTSAKIRVKKNKDLKSWISPPPKLDIEKFNVSFDVFDVHGIPIACHSWAGDALIDFDTQATIIGKWKGKLPNPSAKVRVELVVELESYCTYAKFEARAKKQGLDPKKISKADARRLLAEIGDMQAKAFDIPKFKLEFEIQAKNEGKLIQTKPLSLDLPHGINDKHELMIYRLTARPDKKKIISTTKPGYFYTFRAVNERPKIDKD